MTRRRRWILRLAISSVVIAGGAWLLYALWLPSIIRREVNSVFHRAGFQNVAFELKTSSLHATDISKLTAGQQDLLQIAGIEIRYSPLAALRGKLDSIRVIGGHLVVDLDRPPFAAQSGPSTKSGFDLPFEKLELEMCRLILDRRGRQLELPLGGTISRDEENVARISLSSAVQTTPLMIQGTLDTKSGQSDIVAVGNKIDVAPLLEILPSKFTHVVRDLRGQADFSSHYTRSSGEARAMLQLVLWNVSLDTSQELNVALAELNGGLTIDDLLAPATPPDQTIRVKSISIDKSDLKDLMLVLQLIGPHDLHVQQLQFNFGGGVVRTEPFHLDPAHPVFATAVKMENVNLNEALALLTKGRASGSGRVSGSVGITIDWSRVGEGEAVALGDGWFVAERGGNLRLGEATGNFEQMLEQSNPQFATNPEMAEMKQDIVEAVRDFDYDLLEVRITRKDGQERIHLRLNGRGRTGGQVPINLGVNVEGGAMLLNDYLAVKSRVFSSGTAKGSP